MTDRNSRKIFSFHPLAALALFFLPAVISVMCFSLISLTICLIGAALAAFIYGNNPLSIIKMITPICLVIIVFNMVFNHRGATVLFTAFSFSFTAEVLVYSILESMLLMSAALWLCALSGAMGNSGFLCLFSGIIPGMCMIITLTMRTITVMRERARYIKEGSYAFAPKTLPLKNRLLSDSKKLKSLIMWSAEDSVETAASMSARGYDTAQGGHRTNEKLYVFRPFDALCCTACTIFTAFCAYGIASQSYFTDVYSLSVKSSVFTPNIFFTAVLAVLMLLPALSGAIKFSGRITRKCLK